MRNLSFGQCGVRQDSTKSKTGYKKRYDNFKTFILTFQQLVHLLVHKSVIQYFFIHSSLNNSIGSLIASQNKKATLVAFLFYHYTVFFFFINKIIIRTIPARTTTPPAAIGIIGNVFVSSVAFCGTLTGFFVTLI